MRAFVPSRGAKREGSNRSNSPLRQTVRRTAGVCAQPSSAGTRLRTPQITFCDAQLWFAECPVKMKANYRASGELGTLFAVTCTIRILRRRMG